MANFAIVILAAGNSSRMGQPKQLLDFGGRPLIRHAAEVALASLGRPVVVVCGQYEPEARFALGGLPVQFSSNPQWAGGMGTSIHAGLRVLENQPLDGAILTLGDMPLLTARTYDDLILSHIASARPIVASTYAGTFGVPVLFSKKFFPALAALAPNQGCKGVIQANLNNTLQLACPEAEADIDTPADYANALRALAAS